MASRFRPATLETARPSILSLPSSRFLFERRTSPHFFTNMSPRMFSTSDDKENDARKSQTSLVYFSRRFFKDDQDLVNFVDKFSRLNHDEKSLLMMTPHEFFQKAWKEGWYHEVALKYFFKENLHGCNADAVLLDFYKWKEYNAIGIDDYEKSMLSHKNDRNHSPEQNEYQQNLSDEPERVQSLVVRHTDPTTDNLTISPIQGKDELGHKPMTQYMEKLKEIDRERSLTAALNRGREFVASILGDIHDIPESNGMRVLRQIPGLDFGKKYDLVIRSITQPFWEECIRIVTTRDFDLRVCAVGTPGIGKTSSTPFLIRLLLKEKRTVVYRRLSSEYFWEFAWKNEEGYVVTVYSQKTSLSEVGSLRDCSTFYIVDPGSTRNNCVPDTLIDARTIIVASPNEGNWGSSGFEKLRGSVMGMFLYFPMWSLKDILDSKPYFSGTPPSDEELTERFRQVGGIPRHIYLPNEVSFGVDLFDRCLQLQDDAVRALTFEQAQEIVDGKWDAVGSFGPNQPKSALIGYALPPGEKPFSTRYVKIVSQSVAESIAEKFVGDFWDFMLKKDRSHSTIFEDYCRRLMSRPARVFRSRPCCGKSDPGFHKEADVTLGGCTAIRMTSDIAKVVIDSNPMTIYHSIDPKYPVIDFIYKDSQGKIHAFQPTLGETHDFKPDGMKHLREKIGNIPLEIYCLTPGDNWKKFVTNPTIPETDTLTKVWHVLIPNPKKEQLF